MKKVILSIILIFSILVFKSTTDNLFANDDKHKVIVIVDTEKLSENNIEKMLSEGKYENVKSSNSNALDLAKEKIIKEIGEFKEIARDDFLIPFITLEADDNEVSKIKSLDFVKSVDFDVDYTRPVEVKKVNFGFRSGIQSARVIGVDDTFRKMYDGSGEAVAVIDANFTPDHQVFKLDENVKVSITKDDVKKLVNKNKSYFEDVTENELYLNSKIPFAYHYINKNTNLNPEKKDEGHGQHVAGIIAGNYALVNGKYEWKGVAPNSQLLMMNCFANEATSSTYYIKAISDAVYLRATSINMSLGRPKGNLKEFSTSDKLVSDIIDKAQQLGTNVVIAAGNEGDYEGDISVENPDYGNMGTPAIHDKAISVASIENDEYIAEFFTQGGKKVVYNSSEGKKFENGSYMVVDCKDGLSNDDFKDVNGKVAFIRRGGDTFYNKVIKAERAGAKGVIIYNNVLGNFLIAIEEQINIPVIGVFMTDGEALLKNLNEPIVITGEKDLVRNPMEGTISAFTNWGLTTDGILKPDLTAPGGHIYSANNRFGFFDLSGTSMATPHVSGASALVSQSLKTRSGFENLTVAERGSLVKTILMNSARPVLDKANKVPVSPRRQGAGVVDMKSAVTLDFTAVDSNTQGASTFVDNVNEEIVLNLTLKNYGKDKTIIPSVVVTVDDRDGNKNLLRPKELFSKTYDNQNITLSSGEEKNVVIRIPLENLESLGEYKNGLFVEGFLTLSANNGQKVNFPFVSFKGSFANIPMIEKSVYEFDFAKEHPMFWNLKPTSNAWHRFMTHLESKIDNKLVVLGMKNFNEIDEVRKTKKDAELVPTFYDKLVLSPNSDGKLDELNVFSVFTRTADAKVQLLDESGKLIKETENKLHIKNISNWADREDLDNRYLGFTNLGDLDLNGLPDGNYKVNIVGKPVVKDAKEQTYTMEFSIDNTKPKFENISENDKKVEFTVSDDNEISSVKALVTKTVMIDYYGYQYPSRETSEVELKKNDKGNYEFTLEEGVEKKDVVIKAQDIAYNEYSEDLDLMTTTENLGKLTVVSTTKDGEKVPVKFELTDAATFQEVTNYDKLRKGNYKFEFKFCPIEYRLVGEPAHEFSITDDHLEHTINLQFERVKIGSKMILIRGTGNIEYKDFKITAKNLETGREFPVTQEFEGTPQYYLKAPYGKYQLALKYTNQIIESKYEHKFSEEEITIDEKSLEDRVDLIFSENKYKVIPVTEGYDGEIEYYGMNLSVGQPIGIRHIGKGLSEIFPLEVPKGYYVTPGVHTVKLTEENPEQRVVFKYNKEKPESERAGLVIKDNSKELKIDAKYKIYNYNERFNLEKGKISLDYTPGMKLNPGWYCIEAQETETNKAQATEPTPTFNIYEKVLEVKESDTGTISVGFKWSGEGDNTFVEKFPRNIRVKTPKHYPDKIVELGFYTPENPKTPVLKYSYNLEDLKGQSVVLPSGSQYIVKVENLPAGYRQSETTLYVYGPTDRVEDIIISKIPVDGKEVNVKFKVGDIEVPNVKFMVDETEFVSGKNVLELGTHNFEITSPTSYVGKNVEKQFEITKDTEEVVINLQEISEGTVNFKFDFVETEDKPVKISINDKIVELTGKPVPVKIGKNVVKIISIGDGEKVERIYSANTDNGVGLYIIEPSNPYEFTLGYENPDMDLTFRIRKDSEKIDVTELEKLVNESEEILKSDKYLKSSDEVKKLYDESISQAKKVLEDKTLLTDITLMKSINDIKIAKEALEGNLSYIDTLNKLRKLISQKEEFVKSTEFAKLSENLKARYIKLIEDAKALLNVNFAEYELNIYIIEIEKIIDEVVEKPNVDDNTGNTDNNGNVNDDGQNEDKPKPNDDNSNDNGKPKPSVEDTKIIKKDNLPKTAISSFPMLLSHLSLVAIVLLKKRNK